MSSPGGLGKIILPRESRNAILDQIEGLSYHVEYCDASYFGNLSQRLRRYLEGEAVDFPDALDLTGTTDFQQSVWRITRAIPYGETRSYGWVARQLGLAKAARAVGQALGKNPLPIVVPCHRVIGSHGALGGFSAGAQMKRRLLDLEAAH